MHNREVDGMNRLALAAGTLWRRVEAARIRQLIRRQRPDVVHFHNTFPLISPAAYYAAQAEGVPVVQTLHNYRLLCPAATFYRHGQVCEDCLGWSLPWPAVRHGCYRRSRAQSAVVAGMLSLHRAMGTWRTRVDRWIALTQFARAKFVAGGLPAERITVKPNFAADPGPPEPSRKNPRRGLFVGRLSEEKGLTTLMSACRGLDLEMAIIGDGPQRLALEAMAPPNVRFLGGRSGSEVKEAMAEAGFLVVPSTWFEGFPMVVVEAFAAGLPVLAARLGSLAEIVTDGETGRHFEPGDPRSLAESLSWVLDHPEALGGMAEAARHQYLRNFSPEENCRSLLSIYGHAIGGHCGFE